MSRRSLVHLVWLIIGVYISITLTRSLWQLYGASDRVGQQADKLDKMEEHVSELKSRLEYVRSYEFVEKEAREKLNLQRPGEIVLVLPEAQAQVQFEEERQELEPENWEKWLALFL